MGMVRQAARTSVLLAVLSGTALAADLPYRRAPLVAVPAAFTWTGFYVGLNAGGALSDPSFTFGPGPTFGNAFPTLPVGSPSARLTRDSSSFTGGVQTGYNFQIGSFVFGEESDVNYLNMSQRGSAAFAVPAAVAPGGTFNTSLRSRVEGLSTHRLRVGFTPFERMLVYGTVGIAVAEVRSTSVSTFSPAPGAAFDFIGRDSTYRAGWVAGGGVEYALTNTVSLRGEYLHVDLGRESFASVGNGAAGASFVTFENRERTRFDLARVGLNVRFDAVSDLIPGLTGAIGLPAFAMTAPPGRYDWTGFHIGAFGGAAQDDSRLVVGPGSLLSLPAAAPLAAAIPAGVRGRSTSGIGGITAGYDKQFGNLVIGSEADFGWFNLSSRRVSSTPVAGVAVVVEGSVRNRIEDLATFRTRIGYTLTDTLMIYGTTGLAVADVDNTVSVNIRNPFAPAGLFGAKSTFRAGSVYGGGFEYAVTPSLSIKAEYLRVNLQHQGFFAEADAGSLAAAAVQLPARDSAKFDLARVGVNYRFVTPDGFLNGF